MGGSEADAANIFDAILREDGIAARLIVLSSAAVFPDSVRELVKPELVRPAAIEQEMARMRSGGYGTWLLSQPEPTPEALEKWLKLLKSVAPNLRERYLQIGRLGPRHRRGGRPVELADPVLRGKIRNEIKMLRDPGMTFDKIYERLAAKYNVSPTTIKRIRESGDSTK
jgi:hypothetical protein